MVPKRLCAKCGGMLDATEYALDAIAAICGMEDWSYPGEIVLEVQKVVSRARALKEELDDS